MGWVNLLDLGMLQWCCVLKGSPEYACALMGMVHFLGVAQLSAAAHIPDGSVTFGATRVIAMAPLDTAKPVSRVVDGYNAVSYTHLTLPTILRV